MIAWSLRGEAGRIDLGKAPDGVHDYFLGGRTSWPGVPMRSTAFTESPMVGSRVKAVRVGRQRGVLEVVVPGDGREALWRRLVDVVAYDDAQPLPRWVAAYPDGSELQLPFVAQGVDSILWRPSLDRALLELSFPHPYWRAVEPVQIRAEFGGGEPLLPEFEKQQVVSSLAATERFVTNPGQVAVPVSWTLTGPANAGASVSINGAGFTFSEPLGVGESRQVTVSTDGVAVRDESGADRFHELSWLPQFPWLPKGTSQVSIQVTGAQASTTLIGSFFPEYEVVHDE